MKYKVTEYFESYENAIVEANSKEEAINKIWNDEEHNGEIIDCEEVKNET